MFWQAGALEALKNKSKLVKSIKILENCLQRTLFLVKLENSSTKLFGYILHGFSVDFENFQEIFKKNFKKFANGYF